MADIEDRIIREPECRAITGLSRTRRYELEQMGEFPRRIQLSQRAVGWRWSAIQAWLESRSPAQSRAAS